MHKSPPPPASSLSFAVLATLLVLLLWIASYLTPGARAGQFRRPESGGGAAGTCITAADRKWIDAQIADYETRGRRRFSGGGPQPMPFYPLGGNMGQEMWIGNFVDLDTSTAVGTWECSTSAYDGHDGHDSHHGRRNCQRKELGIPVFAALDGTVVTTRDGHFDDYGCSTPLGSNDTPANMVVLDHGNTQYTTYLHLKSGSVTVSPGQVIRAGAQIGLVGSSGKSTAPHLHLETKFAGVKYESMRGTCNDVESGWEQQPAFSGPHLTEAYVVENGVPKGQWTPGSHVVGARFALAARPAGTTLQYRYYRPDGSLAKSPSVDWTTKPYDNLGLWNFGWWVNLNVTGRWRLQLALDGVPLADLPFDVVASEAEIGNRPPHGVTIVLDPLRPDPERALFCRIRDPYLVVDPDYDLVKYRYEWLVNGVPARSLVSAGQADALPAGTVSYGDMVACRVTPIDEEEEEGPATYAERLVGGWITGRTTLGGSGLPGVTVRAGDYSAVTAEDGTFAIGGLPPATHPVTPQKTGYSFSPASRSVTTAPDAAGADFAATVLAPGSLAVRAVTETRIRLTWEDRTPGERGYRVERRTPSTGWVEKAALPTDTVTWTDSTVTPGILHYYRVRAEIAGGFSPYSQSVTLMAGAPPVPGGMSAAAVSATQVRLGWSDSSSVETAYRLERRSGSGSWSQVVELPANTRSYIDGGLVPEVLYYYRLRSVNGDVASQPGAEVSAATWEVPPPPDALNAVTQPKGEIKLSWLDNTSTETGFRVERRTGSTSFVEVASLPAGSRSYVDRDVEALVLYYYRCRAVSGGRSSAYSRVAFASAGIPPAPDTFAAAAISATEIRLTWRDTSSVNTPFYIERRTPTRSWTNRAQVPATATSYTDTGLPSSTEFRYRVRCANGSALSPYTPEEGATTWAPPPAPTGVQAVLNSLKQPRVSWSDSAVTTATGYRIERRVAITGSWAEIGAVGGTVRALVDTGAAGGKTYEYRVRGVSGSRFSPYGNTAKITVP